MKYQALNQNIALATQVPIRGLTKYCELHQVSEDAFLLMHLLTGAVDILDDEAKNVIQILMSSEDLSHESGEFITYLVERGYFADPDAEQEFIVACAEEHQRSLAHKPMEFFICTTFRCPVGCSYCFEGDLTTNTKVPPISNEQIESAFASIETILAEKEKPLREIVLFGGEPLLPATQGAVREILRRAHAVGYPVTVCTSGVFLKDFVPIFDEFPGTVRLVRVTLDGPRAYHDSLRSLPHAFDRAVEGIEALLQAGYGVMIRINVGKENLDAIPELARYFIERGWIHYPKFEAIVTGIKDRTCVGDKSQIFREDELALRFLSMRQDFPEMKYLRPLNIFMSLRHLATNLGHLDGLVTLREAVVPLQTIKFHGCGATDGTLYVFGSDGRIYVCTEGIGNPIMSVGSFHPRLDIRAGLLSKWQGWHKYAIVKCRACKYLMVCGGTCTLTSVKVFGAGHEPICPPIPSIINGYVKGLANRIHIA